ncbi:MAG: SMC-Scp complex subunit ScpB [Planctomycetaceae bacterium]|nr:SMC-Scp complex subunit ScpB [Planctomycetaceae bacterium]
MSAADDAEKTPEQDAEPESLSIFSGDETEDEETDDFWSGEDLERAYQEAVSTLDHIEQELPSAKLFDESTDNHDEESDEDAVQSLNDFPGFADEIPAAPATEETHTEPDSNSTPSVPRLQPARIIEAALFVGGMPLTIKKLSGVLRDEFDRDYIERAIDELNFQYDDQNRPYEIRLEEGGYRMGLRPEYESVRNKSYGFGPKEVRLSQDVLEVLALVAYKQPITKEDIEKAGKSNANGALRQLLRREIIGLERNGKSAKDITYHTTARFLQIFGLADLNELPRSEDLSFK